MGVSLGRPAVDGLCEVITAHREWQREEHPMQLHPGDLGWQWRMGPEATASAVRTWSRSAEVLAIAFLDEPTVLRVAIAPAFLQDEELAVRLANDIAQPGRGLLAQGKAAVEITPHALARELLLKRGWLADEPWTQLRLDLREPIASPGLRVEVVGSAQVKDRVDVQRAAFVTSTFTEERWHAMAAGVPYVDGRCLVGYDAQHRAVAATTVWSAGPGRAGLIEPLGVHRDHRGHGHGRSITIAAADALREMGSSSARVCTPSANLPGIATYLSAGFRQIAVVADLARPGIAL